MPTKTSARPAPANRAPAPRTPAMTAIERMAKLASSGAPAMRMVTAVNDILAGWGAEELDDAEMRERVEQLQAGLDAGAEAAEDFVAEAETPAQKRGAEGQVAALRAAKDRLARAMEGRASSR